MNRFLSIICVLCCCSCTVSTETEKYQSKRDNIVNVRDQIVEIKIEDPMISSSCDLYLMDDYLIIQEQNPYFTDKYIPLVKELL